MPKKQKFKPTIRKVVLNPEQAVLSCACSTNAVISIVYNASAPDVQYCAPLYRNLRTWTVDTASCNVIS